jgi:hypothetical protein
VLHLQHLGEVLWCGCTNDLILPWIISDYYHHGYA